jgi:large subunit ribosomal protein L7/L12
MFRDGFNEQRFVAAIEKIADAYDASVRHQATLPVSAPGDTINKVLGLKRAGEVINAIKMLRQMTGLGLKESKDIVDAMPRF